MTDVELNYDLHVLGLEHRLMATLEDGKLLWRQHASTNAAPLAEMVGAGSFRSGRTNHWGQESGLKSDILTATSEPNQSVSVSVALLLLGMGSVTPLGPATVALSEIESVADALIVPVAL